MRVGTLLLTGFAKRNGLRVREVEAAIEAAVEDERLAEAARRRHRIENWKPGPILYGIDDPRSYDLQMRDDE